MLWYSKLDKLKKIMLLNFAMIFAGYHVALFISYLCVWLELSFYGYDQINLLLYLIYLSNSAFLWVYLRRPVISRQFSNRMLIYQCIIWFILFSLWNFLMVEQRVITLLCSMVMLSFLYAYSTLLFSILLTLAVSLIHLASTYIGLNYYLHPGNFQNEVVNALAFFLSAMIVAAILHRLSSLLRNQASNDHLTKLLNRRSMSKHISNEHLRCKRHEVSAALVMIDLDDFKVINDTYGHDGGDAVLIEIAKTLKKELRNIDYLARWGGEEFIALLVGADRKTAGIPIQRVLHHLKQNAVKFGEQLIPVSFSAGMVELSEFDTVEDAIREADKLLYLAKSEGKGRLFSDY